MCKGNNKSAIAARVEPKLPIYHLWFKSPRVHAVAAAARGQSSLRVMPSSAVINRATIAAIRAALSKMSISFSIVLGIRLKIGIDTGFEERAVSGSVLQN